MCDILKPFEGGVLADLGLGADPVAEALKVEVLHAAGAAAETEEGVGFRESISEAVSAVLRVLLRWCIRLFLMQFELVNLEFLRSYFDAISFSQFGGLVSAQYSP
jgi:hypothetical protein